MRTVAPTLLALILCGADASTAGFVPLQNATATFSQSGFGGNSIQQATDGDFGNRNGWAIFENDFDSTAFGATHAQTAVFESVTDAGFSGGTLLTFTLHQLFFPNAFNGRHTLGRFRLSITTDDRSEFADGLQTGGDVTANWTALVPSFVHSSGGATLSVLSDHSILAGGFSPETDVYTVQASTLLIGITGFRLEVLEDDTLPDSGPGRFTQGNFTLTEFEVDASPLAEVPEPLSLTFFVFGVIGLAVSGRWTPHTR